MVVVGDLVVRVLRHLAQDVPQLVHGAALDLRPSPRERDRAVQTGVPVDNAQPRCLQAALDQALQEALPRRARLGAADLEAHEPLRPVAEDGDAGQHGQAGDAASGAHAQRESRPRYRYTTLRSASDCLLHASHSPRSVPTIRDTALLDSGAFFSSGRSAPRMRRVFPPDR